MAYKKTIKIIITAVMISAIFVFWQSYQFMQSPVAIDEQGLQYQFSKGSTASKLIYDLQQQQVIDDSLYFKIWGRLSGQSKKLQAGEYFFPAGITPFQILDKMASGDVKLYAFTIIEGWSFKQLLAAIAKDQYLIKKLQASDDHKSIMTKIGYPNEHPEGRFFPDTYRFPTGTTDVQFLKRAYQQMVLHLEMEWENKASGLPLKTAYEALILASIVEKESAAPSERPVIAGVFINRLNKNMRLQTDPTVIYGIGDSYDGDIRFRHLREDTPYNTYTRKGLPPTPIAMPGLEAIHAALNPAATEYLYFVATGEDGKHYFSSTNAEHQRAVTKYQRYKRKKKN